MDPPSTTAPRRKKAGRGSYDFVEEKLLTGLSTKQTAIELTLKKFEDFRVEQERLADLKETQQREAALEERRERVRQRWERSQQQRAMLNGFMAHLSDVHVTQMERMHDIERRDLSLELAMKERREFFRGKATEKSRMELARGLADFEGGSLQRRRDARSDSPSRPPLAATGTATSLNTTSTARRRRPSVFAPPEQGRDPSVALTRALRPDDTSSSSGVQADNRRGRAVSVGATVRGSTAAGRAKPAPPITEADFPLGMQGLARSFGAAYDPADGDSYAATVKARRASQAARQRENVLNEIRRSLLQGHGMPTGLGTATISNNGASGVVAEGYGSAAADQYASHSVPANGDATTQQTVTSSLEWAAHREAQRDAYAAMPAWLDGERARLERERRMYQSISTDSGAGLTVRTTQGARRRVAIEEGEKAALGFASWAPSEGGQALKPSTLSTTAIRDTPTDRSQQARRHSASVSVAPLAMLSASDVGSDGRLPMGWRLLQLADPDADARAGEATSVNMAPDGLNPTAIASALQSVADAAPYITASLGVTITGLNRSPASSESGDSLAVEVDVGPVMKPPRPLRLVSEAPSITDAAAGSVDVSAAAEKRLCRRLGLLHITPSDVHATALAYLRDRIIQAVADAESKEAPTPPEVQAALTILTAEPFKAAVAQQAAEGAIKLSSEQLRKVLSSPQFGVEAAALQSYAIFALSQYAAMTSAVRKELASLAGDGGTATASAPGSRAAASSAATGLTGGEASAYYAISDAKLRAIIAAMPKADVDAAAAALGTVVQPFLGILHP